MNGRTLGEKLILLAATGCGLGWIPVAPGTFGTLAGIPLILAASLLPVSMAFFPWLLVCLILFSVWIADEAEKIMGKKDPGAIVIDEVAGYCVALSMVPWTMIYMGLGFVLFRIFDITKPFPVRYFEKNFSGGAGIVLDDLVAGAIAGFLLKCIQMSGVL